jgi:hypothetical protein
MTDNTLDAAILSGMMAVGGHPTNDDQRRTYARALIAKLLEGMEPPIMHDRIHPGIKHGFDFALTEIRRRAGLEVEL